MNTQSHGIQHGVNLDSLLVQRAIIIKKAQENVRASHQRMRSRVHGSR
jgi:hypothetical protein